MYRELYPGIDVVFHPADSGLFEFDVILKAGADPGAIRLRSAPGQQFSLNRNGTVELRGSAGDRISFQKPHTVQTDHGIRRDVAAHYKINKAGEVSFRVGHNNAALPLCIELV